MSISFNTLFKNNCLRYPMRKALSYEDKTYSYEELDQRSTQFASYLKSQDVKKDMIVAVISRNYLERIVSIISLWKLGAAYLPIDPNYPLTRINFILDDSKVNFVITDNELFKNFFLNSQFVSILLDEENIDVTNTLAGDFSDANNVNNIAYIAYTSGSTGNPKGAIITHGNISSIYNAWKEVYKLNHRDQHLQIANFGFDVCSGDIIRALGSGAHLVMCPPEIILQPDKLYALLTEATITVAEFTPIVLRKLIAYINQERLNLNFMRLLICGSDSWSLKEYKEFRSFLSPDARLINSYGTTEATIDSAYFEVDEKTLPFFDEQSSVPLGRPFPNVTVKVLNEEYEDCLPGVPGEIYIGGAGVSIGYLNQPQLTKEKFIKLPGHGETSIFYKTGDLGRYFPDGNIDFLGRIDYQIKIMGYRIGLFEVEEALNRYSAIQKAVIVTHSAMGSDEKFLVAFILPNPEFEVNEHIAFLKKHLPVYTIPVFYLFTPVFPISDHGKLDRLKLTSMLTCKDTVDCFENVFNQKYINESKIERTLLKILKNIFNIHSLNSNNCFFSIDTNPLLLAKFLTEMEIFFDLKFELKDFVAIHTVMELVKLLETKLKKVKNCQGRNLELGKVIQNVK